MEPLLKDISLIRTVPGVPIVRFYVQINLRNKDTFLTRTHFLGPVVYKIERFHCIACFSACTQTIALKLMFADRYGKRTGQEEYCLHPFLYTCIY